MNYSIIKHWGYVPADTEEGEFTAPREVLAQMGVANALLDAIYLIDPNSIIAGGAPRNWYFGKLASDLDLYFWTPHDTSSAVKGLLGYAGLIDPSHCVTHESRDEPGGGRAQQHYNTMPDVHRVFHTSFKGQDVDIVQMRVPTFHSVVPEFDASINKTWYKNRVITLEREFLIPESLGVIVLKDGYDKNDPHPQKLAKLFPEKQLIGKGEMTLKLHKKLLEVVKDKAA